MRTTSVTVALLLVGCFWGFRASAQWQFLQPLVINGIVDDIFDNLNAWTANHPSTSTWQKLPADGEQRVRPADPCIDCGAPDEYMDRDSFNALLDSLSRDRPFSASSGRCFLRMVIDTEGRAVVRSYRGDLSRSNAITLAGRITMYKDWHPAHQGGRSLPVSFTCALVWGSGGIKFSIVRVNKALAKGNFNNPGLLLITNTHYTYHNKPVARYAFRVWTKSNSAIPYDLGASITVDKNGSVWEGTFNGLAACHDDHIQVYNGENTPFGLSDERLWVRSAATDSVGNKWFSVDGKVYAFDNSKWTTFDSSQTGLGRTLSISVAPGGQIICSGFGGFSTYDGGHWKLNDSAAAHLPSSRVLYANYDTKGRLWIGTLKGVVMTDGARSVNYSTEQPLLAGLTVTRMAEDGEGNLWFAALAFDKKVSGGLLELTASGQWRIYNTSNSGLPAGHVNTLLFNPRDHALWISVDNVGLVRYDRNEDWSLFTPKNSGVPSSVIFGMAEDRDGNTWCATGSGLLEVSEKSKEDKVAPWAKP